MRRKGIWILAALVAIGVAYLAGSWPERGARRAAEAQAGALRAQLARAEAQVRTGTLLGRVLSIKELVMQQDYGQAQERSSALFDAIRREVTAIPEGRLRDGLTAALRKRDRVTAGLARGEPGTTQILHDVERDLRGALDYEIPPLANATP